MRQTSTFVQFLIALGVAQGVLIVVALVMVSSASGASSSAESSSGQGWTLVATALASTALSLVIAGYFWRRSMASARHFGESLRQINREGTRLGEWRWRHGSEWRPMGTAIEELNERLVQREHRRNEANARMSAVFGGMIEGVVATDADSRILLANDAACTMLGQRVDDLLGKRLFDMARYAPLREAVEGAQATRTMRTTEFETLGARRRLLKATVTALEGDFDGAVVVLDDVTELRRMETMRRDFVANVSHELKTPLAVIKACAETLLLGALHDDSANTDFVKQIEVQSEVLNQQVQRLLELARAQSGSQAFEVRSLDAVPLCQRVMETFQAEADKRQIELGMDFPDSPVRVVADDDALHTILQNLVSNAVRYTPAGGRIQVRLTADDNQVHFDVIDTGIGIARDQRDRIFERFYRVDKARSRDQGGTGLGLAIVKNLVHSLEGTIELDSHVGKGSRFRVSLPAAPTGDTDEGHAAGRD